MHKINPSSSVLALIRSSCISTLFTTFYSSAYRDVSPVRWRKPRTDLPRRPMTSINLAGNDSAEASSPQPDLRRKRQETRSHRGKTCGRVHDGGRTQ
ncbi:hypothetical protein GN956_G942 [Arapaima gigas]